MILYFHITDQLVASSVLLHTSINTWVGYRVFIFCYCTAEYHEQKSAPYNT